MDAALSLCSILLFLFITQEQITLKRMGVPQEDIWSHFHLAFHLQLYDVYCYLCHSIVTINHFGCQSDIIHSNHTPHHSMPPKRSKRNDAPRSSATQHTVIAIEEHFRRAAQGDSPAEVARKLNLSYHEEPQSLSNSLGCFVLRACGLAGAVGKLNFDNVSSSISTIVGLVDEKKLEYVGDSNLLINHKDKSHERYITRIREFLTLMLNEDSEAMRNHKENKMLTNIHEWIDILSKSLMRSLRLSSLTLMKLLVQTMTGHFTSLINRKQSRKAFELVREVELYLPIIKNRLKDIDPRVRDTVHVALRGALLSMETDLASDQTLDEVFLSLVKDINPKIIEGTVETLLQITQKSAKLRKVMLVFAKKNSIEMERVSIMPTKAGVLALRILIQLHRADPEAGLLHPTHISRIFQCHSIEKYIFGLQTAVDAFYASIYPNTEDILKNNTIVAIEIMNLINNFNSLLVRQIILTQFCENSKVPIEEVFMIPDLFNVLTNQAYTHNSEEIELKERDMVSWVLLIDTFITYVRKHIDRLQHVESEKMQKEKEKWRAVGEAYNMHLLSNVKTIIHQKMQGNLAKHFLKLMGKVILPVSSAFQGYLDYMYDRIVAIFQRETDPDVFREIVLIFYRTNTHNISLLVNGIAKLTGRNRKEKTVILMKKLAILGQYFIEDLAGIDTVSEVISALKQAESEQFKTSLLLGLFTIHQWWPNYFIQNDADGFKFRQYGQVQKAILQFLFDVLDSRERNTFKFKVLTCLLNIFEIICCDAFQGAENIYYVLKEHEINAIYKFLNSELDLPIAEQNDDETRDFTRMMSNLSFEDSEREKILLKIFSLFDVSSKLAVHPSSLKLIAGALLAEEQKLQNTDQSTTRPNMSISIDRSPYQSIYARERPASKYLEKLVEKEVIPQNRNNFIFWQIIQEVYKVLRGQGKAKRAFTAKAMDAYFKKKLNGEPLKASINKALLFVISEVDRIYEDGCFQELSCINIIMSKVLKRKIGKEAPKRIFKFIKEKPEPNEFKDAYKNLLIFLDKASKSGEEQPEEEEEEGEVEEGNEREMMRPVENRRETRSTSKRQHK